MPKHHYQTKKHRGHVKTSVTIRHGEVFSLCRCWQSKKFPLCDGSHKYIEDEKGPVVIHTACESDFLNKDA